jgi:hypothetical protein
MSSNPAHNPGLFYSSVLLTFWIRVVLLTIVAARKQCHVPHTWRRLHEPAGESGT